MLRDEMIRSLKILLTKQHGKFIELKESHSSNILIFIIIKMFCKYWLF